MFKRTIWFLVLLCGYESSSVISEGNVHYKANAFNRELKNDVNRPKRGIALVDEDFDVPPRAGNGVKEYDGIFEEDHLGNFPESSGDGTSEEWGMDETKSFTRPPSESGYSEVANTTSITQSVKKVTELMDKSSSKKQFASEIPDTTLVSSGDGMSQTNGQSTPEITTKINLKPEDDAYENLPDTCLNSSTCSVFDLDILPAEYNLIPEGTNLTLTCRSNFSSHHTGMLYWYYKSNGSTYILQTLGRGKRLQLNLQETGVFHTGMYKCVEWVHTEFCCSKEVHLIVYEVPLYKFHLIILALIAAVGLLMCIFLAVRQSRSLKTYTKEFAKRHGSIRQQLL